MSDFDKDRLKDLYKIWVYQDDEDAYDVLLTMMETQNVKVKSRDRLFKNFLFRLICSQDAIQNITYDNFDKFFGGFKTWYGKKVKKIKKRLDKAADAYWKGYMEGHDELVCLPYEDDNLIPQHWKPLFWNTEEEEIAKEVEEETAEEVEEETAEPETSDTEVDGIQQRGAKFTSISFTFEPPTVSAYGMEETDSKSQAFRNKLMRKLKNVTENEFFSASLSYIIYFTSTISAVEVKFNINPNSKEGSVILSIPSGWKDRLDVKESLILKKFASAWEEALDYADPTFDPEEHDEYDLWDELLHA